MKRFTLFLLMFEAAYIVNAQPVRPLEFSGSTRDPRTPAVSTGEVYLGRSRHGSSLRALPVRSFYQSRTDWRRIIDSTWGPGSPLATKLAIFDGYANSLSNSFDGFLSLGLNWTSWDSLKNQFRARIDSTTSRGIFASIMAQFAMSLRDAHTWAWDTVVTFTPLSPGVPVLVLYPFATADHFGAVLTALADSTALVLRTVPGHPLGLQPGDVVLGYEGVPWKQLVRELLDAHLPVFSTGVGAASAEIHSFIRNAGNNWHLFETIDILKHSTQDTLHLSVQPLLALPTDPMMGNEQMEIPGIPFSYYRGWPWVPTGQLLASGRIPSANVGYIRLLGEWPSQAADLPFAAAVDSLWNAKGLIIDLRWNAGGWSLFNQAFARMYSQRLYTINDAYRVDPGTFNIVPVAHSEWFVIPGVQGSIYDRPLAVLLGPTCVSMGDITALRLRYHPMARSFGNPPIASHGESINLNGTHGWWLRHSTCDSYHLSQPGVYLNRSEFPIDEPVWFNPDDVAQGRDPVLARALAWMDSLSYAHDVLVNRDTVKSSLDSIHITAKVENPGQHTLIVSAIVTNALGAQVDSVVLVNEPGDTLWGIYIRAPLTNGRYDVSVRTEDVTAGSYRRLPNVGWFTSKIPSSARMICSPDALWLWAGEGDSTISTLTIGNSGGASLDWSIIADSAALKAMSWLSANPSSGTTLPGSRTPVMVTMRAVQPIGSIQQGSLTISSNDTVTGPKTVPVRLSVFRTLSLGVGIEPAWNILSVPLLMSDYSTSFLFPSATTSAFRYQPGTGYVSDSILANGLGYWLKFPAAETRSMAGFAIDADTFTVQAGWNIVGSISADVAADSIGSIPGGIVTGEFYTFTPSGYQVAATINPGKGYWVKMTQPGSLVLSSIPPPMQKIRIVATGEMPPAPPGEVMTENKVEKPREFALVQNYPNPFNPSTTIRYELPMTSHVRLSIHDMLGREVAMVLNEEKTAGTYSVEWDASGVSSGVYFYRLQARPLPGGQAGTFAVTRKLLLLR